MFPASLLGWQAQALVAAFGAVVGSFLNVCIVRVPAGESIVLPASHCRACGTALRWYDNVPIASWLALRGRCRGCKAAISPRYLVVEAIAAALAVLLWRHDVLYAIGPPALAPRVAAFLVHFGFVCVLAVLSFIDLATYRIPNVITYPAVPLFAAASLLLDHPRWWHGPLGAAIGYGSLRLLSDVYFWITGREGMGYGDAKLLAVIGAVMGPHALLPTVFLAALQGSVVGVALAWTGRGRGPEDDEEAPAPDGAAAATPAAGGGEAPAPDGETAAADAADGAPPGASDRGAARSLRQTRIPFGPFLSLGALQTLLGGDWVRALWPFLP